MLNNRPASGFYNQRIKCELNAYVDGPASTFRPLPTRNGGLINTETTGKLGLRYLQDVAADFSGVKHGAYLCACA